MKLRRLRYFVAVARTLNFSRAAEALRIAQPALSRQISDLEEELGFPLFKRTTARVSLTESGRFLLKKVDRVLGQLDVAVGDAQHIAKGAAHMLKIGIDYDVSSVPIAAAARALRERNPKLSAEFVELPMYQHLDAVRSGAIDIGFISGLLSGSRKGIESALVYTCGFKVILPLGHAFAGRKPIRLADLKAEHWVVASDFPGFAGMLTQIFRRSGFAPRFGPSAQSISGMLTLVGDGQGLGLIPEIKLPREPENVIYAGSDGPPFELHAVWLKSSPGRPFLAEYVRILQEKIAGAKPPSKRKPR